MNSIIKRKEKTYSRISEERLIKTILALLSMAKNRLRLAKCFRDING
jgi:hypothetical protein